MIFFNPVLLCFYIYHKYRIIFFNLKLYKEGTWSQNVILINTFNYIYLKVYTKYINYLGNASQFDIIYDKRNDKDNFQ